MIPLRSGQGSLQLDFSSFIEKGMLMRALEIVYLLLDFVFYIIVPLILLQSGHQLLLEFPALLSVIRDGLDKGLSSDHR